MRSIESLLTTMMSDFLVPKTVILISLASGLTAVTVPPMVWKEPETICSAVNLVPSALLSPSARNWSPTFNSANELTLASLNFTESGAYRRNRTSVTVGSTCALQG